MDLQLVLLKTKLVTVTHCLIMYEQATVSLPAEQLMSRLHGKSVE